MGNKKKAHHQIGGNVKALSSKAAASSNRGGD